jgi:large subunit ribosomal protein L32
MSVRMRHTSSHTRNRRSHHALKSRTIVKDKESGALRMPHRLDETTGMYRGKQIMAPKVAKAEVKAPKKRAKKEEEKPTEEAAS